MLPRLLLAAAIACMTLAAPAFAQDDPVVDEQAVAALEAAAQLRQERFGLHQALGLSTLGGLAATVGLGLALSNGRLPPGWEVVHFGAASATTGLYLGTAALALTAPPSPYARGAGEHWSSIGIHRNLAWLHAAGMASTVGLGLATFLIGPQFTPWHGVAAYSTLGLVGASAAVITFGQ